MKSSLLFICLFFTGIIIAQEGTTLEEYRYLSKGYVYQLEMGLDANKEGYKVQNLFTASNNANLVGLYRNGQSKPRALLVILNPHNSKATYICVPNSNADARVKELASTDQKNLASDVIQEYQSALNEFLFAALTVPETGVPRQKKPTVPINYSQDSDLVSRSANIDDYLTMKSPETSTTEKSVDPIPQPMTTSESKNTSTRTVNGMLTTRNIISETDAVTSSKAKGIVAIKICVDSNGDVKTAKFTQRGSTTFNSSLKAAALKAAQKIKFTTLDIPEQCGIINYKF